MMESARYPKDWPALSRRIREREGQACKWCLAPNGVYVRRSKRDPRVWRRAEDFAPACGRDPFEVEWGRAVRIVLTVAHLNHTPEDSREENLAALCQRCHLGHDKEQHAETRRRSRDAKAGQGDLFGRGRAP